MTDSRDYLPDYPAAHSMDTGWFAVDADGHVAFFDSGEAGAVPVDAYLGEDYYALVDELREKLPRTEVIFEAGRHAGEGEMKHAPRMTYPGPSPLLLCLRSRDVAVEIAAETGGSQVAMTAGHGVRVPDISKEIFERVHKSDACLACFFDFSDERGEIAENGIFHYSHTCENWISGPYGLEARPVRPAKIGELPSAVKKAAVKIEGRFGERVEIQPVEHWPCESWESAWLASDRKTVRPFPGKEAELKEFVKAMGEDGLKDFVVDASGAKDGKNGHGPEAKAKKPWWKRW